MKRIDVLWLVEHVAREMDVACAVTCLLRDRFGLEVAVRNMYADAAESLSIFHPRVVVHPFFYYCKGALATEDYVRQWPDAVHFNLAWEEMHYKAHQAIKAPSDAFTKMRVIHNAWGQFYREYLLRHGVPDEHIFLNGHPAYQLYRSPYCNYFQPRSALAARHGLRESARWVFIPENYRWAFIGKKIDTFVKLGGDRDEMGMLHEFSIKSLAELLRWCNAAANEGGAELVFRTRPSTNSDTMASFFHEHVGAAASSLHFIKDGSVREWVLASDAVISSYSTTLIEAALARKPAFSAEPFPLPDALLYDWYQYVPRLRSQAAFKAVCVGVGSECGGALLEQWAESELLSHGDPIVGLAAFVSSLVDQTKGLRTSVGRGLRRAFRNIGNVERRVPLGEAKKGYFNPQSHEHDLFTQEEVEQWVARWRRALNADGMSV